MKMLRAYLIALCGVAVLLASSPASAYIQCCASAACDYPCAHNCVSCYIEFDVALNHYVGICQEQFERAACGCSYPSPGGPPWSGCDGDVGSCHWIYFGYCYQCYDEYMCSSFFRTLETAQAPSAAAISVACSTSPWEPRRDALRPASTARKLGKAPTILSAS